MSLWADIKNKVGWGEAKRDPVLGTWFRTTNTAAKVEVNQNTALNYSAVSAATRLISETIASFPRRVTMRKTRGSKTREDMYSSRLYNMFSLSPNPEQSSFAYYSQQIPFLLNWGNCYAELERNANRQVVNEWPIHPSRIPPQNIVRAGQLRQMIDRGIIEVDDNFDLRDANEIIYLVDNSDDGTEKIPVRRKDMLHIPGALSENGITGKGIVALARESIGMGLATERFGGSWFGNGVNPSVVLKHPRTLSEEGRENLRRSWQMRKGVNNANHMMVLEEGIEVERLAIPPEQAQFLQTRAFNVTEISRWYNVPPHMLRELSKSSFNNIEQENIHFVKLSLMPWICRIEQERDLQLVPKESRKQGLIEHKFVVRGLLRGDMESQAQYYRKMFEIGNMSINAVLEDMGENPIDHKLGDMRFIPANLIPLENAENLGKEKTNGETKSDGESDDSSHGAGGGGGVESAGGGADPVNAVPGESAGTSGGSNKSAVAKAEEGGGRPNSEADENPGKDRNVTNDRNDQGGKEGRNERGGLGERDATSTGETEGQAEDQVNVPAGKAGNTSTDRREAEISRSYTRDILHRMITKEVKAALTTAKREKNRFEANKESTFFNWLDDWSEKHTETMLDALAGPASTWPSAGIYCDLEALVAEHVQMSREAFLKASEVPSYDQLEESMQNITADWQTVRLEESLNRIFSMGA